MTQVQICRQPGRETRQKQSSGLGEVGRLLRTGEPTRTGSGGRSRQTSHPAGVDNSTLTAITTPTAPDPIAGE